jgi:hypothetical protein
MKEQSYIVTIRHKGYRKKKRREHFFARSLSDAALMAEGSIDGLWEVTKIKVLK